MRDHLASGGGFWLTALMEGRLTTRPQNRRVTWLSLCHEGFPCGSAGKESACNAGDLDSIPGLGGSPGEGKGYPLQCSGLANSMDCIVYGVAKSRTRLSHFHFLSLSGFLFLMLHKAFLIIYNLMILDLMTYLRLI